MSLKTLLLSCILFLNCSLSVDKVPALPAYPAFKKHIQEQKKNFSLAYRNTANKDSMLRQLSFYIQILISDSMHAYWKETDWDFYGTTETPGKGSIACGYFVTTVLRDAGFSLNRVALAETYSELMIKSLVRPAFIKKYPNFKLTAFVEDIRKAGDQIYIVGLDYHTGFIICKDKQVYFLHSRYTDYVVKEPALGSEILMDNRYGVTGCISCDDQMLKSWLVKQ